MSNLSSSPPLRSVRSPLSRVDHSLPASESCSPWSITLIPLSSRTPIPFQPPDRIPPAIPYSYHFLSVAGLNLLSLSSLLLVFHLFHLRSPPPTCRPLIVTTLPLRDEQSESHHSALRAAEFDVYGAGSGCSVVFLLCSPIVLSNPSLSLVVQRVQGAALTGAKRRAPDDLTCRFLSISSLPWSVCAPCSFSPFSSSITLDFTSNGDEWHESLTGAKRPKICSSFLSLFDSCNSVIWMKQMDSAVVARLLMVLVVRVQVRKRAQRSEKFGCFGWVF